MNELPNNIDCNREEIKHCDWYMHKLCRETCGYAEYIMGLGVGAMCDSELVKKLNNVITKKLI